MLPQNIYISNPQSIGNGRYTVELFFVDQNVAKYINLGDYIRDKNNREYSIVSPLSLPVSEGATITVLAKSDDVAPTEDSSYDSTVFTPGQISYEPEVKTAGELLTVTAYQPWNYEYTVTADWFEPLQSSKAVVGDSIVDESGKEFLISYLSEDGFSGPFRVVEREKTMSAPIIGNATLYRSTSTYRFYQGTNLSLNATLRVLQRDNAMIDTQSYPNGNWVDYHYVITAEDVAAKQFLLNPVPKEPTEVNVEWEGGPDLEGGGIDYVIELNMCKWGALGLDGAIAVGDLIHLQYFS